ncbi:PA2169 family four-helix-bundle protein [Cytophagaceae bacterium ABcell3]|nr:PA2169 family four-helix-bundle protein [Cytophagaceae bacterium ABcell3]
MKEQKEIISKINDLIEVCNERVQGYRTAAKDVNDQELTSLFEQYARQTEDFVKELMPYSDEINPEEIGTRTIGDAWKIWIDLKASITKGGREAILGACITGEQAAIRAYEDNLEENLPMELRNIIVKQLGELRSALGNIKAKKEALH